MDSMMSGLIAPSKQLFPTSFIIFAFQIPVRPPSTICQPTLCLTHSVKLISSPLRIIFLGALSVSWTVSIRSNLDLVQAKPLAWSRSPPHLQQLHSFSS